MDVNVYNTLHKIRYEENKRELLKQQAEAQATQDKKSADVNNSGRVDISQYSDLNLGRRESELLEDALTGNL